MANIGKIKSLAKHGYNAIEIMAMLNVGGRIEAFRKFLRENGIKAKRRIVKDCHDQIVELSNNGLSTFKVAKELQFSYITIKNYKSKNSIVTAIRKSTLKLPKPDCRSKQLVENAILKLRRAGRIVYDYSVLANGGSTPRDYTGYTVVNDVNNVLNDRQLCRLARKL